MKLAREATTVVGRDLAEVERRITFGRLAERRLDWAYNLGRMLLGSSAEAEDAVHDSFVQAWLHWGDLRDSSRIDAWFDRILINVCRGRLRRRKVRPLELGESNAGCAQDLYAAVHERNALGQALAGLKPNHRVVIFLRYYADLTPREIAWRTGEREGTVKSRLHYGLRQLRAAIESGER